MKKFTIIVMIMMTLLLVSCGKSETAASKTTVLFWHSMGGPLGSALNSLIEEFNATHIDIRVEAVSVGCLTRRFK